MDGLLGVAGMMKLIVSQWIIPENSLRLAPVSLGLQYQCAKKMGHGWECRQLVNWIKIIPSDCTPKNIKKTIVETTTNHYYSL